MTLERIVMLSAISVLVTATPAPAQTLSGDILQDGSA